MTMSLPAGAGGAGLVPVSVTVEDASGTELYSGSALPDETYGDFRVDLRGILDVQPGHIVDGVGRDRDQDP